MRDNPGDIADWRSANLASIPGPPDGTLSPFPTTFFLVRGFPSHEDGTGTCADNRLGIRAALVLRPIGVIKLIVDRSLPHSEQQNGSFLLPIADEIDDDQIGFFACDTLHQMPDTYRYSVRQSLAIVAIKSHSTLPLEKGIANRELARNRLARMKVFGIQSRAPSFHSSGNDQRIIDGKYKHIMQRLCKRIALS